MNATRRLCSACLAATAAIVVAVSTQAQQRPVVKPQIRKVPAPLVSVVTHTELKVCVHAAGCPPSVPGLVAELPLDLSQSLNREFTWTTDAKSATSGRWQVARRPFPAAAASRPDGLIGEGDAGPGSAGKFWIDLRKLPTGSGAPASGRLAPRPTLQQAGPSAASLIGGTYFVRVVTLAGATIVGSPSNTVTIRVNAAAKPASPPSNPLVTYPTDVYSVSIVSFEPVRPATLPWGCVEVVSVDPAVAGLPTHQRWRDALAKRRPVCPSAFKGVGEKSWYEAFWDFATSGVDWASGVYADIKRKVIETVVDAINTLPGHLCNDRCEAALTTGLDVGLVALGIPPDIPSLQELTDQGLDYLVEVAATEAGIPCDAGCREEIRKGVRVMAEQVERNTVEQGCGNVELAHRHGAEPLCPPPGVSVKPAPGSTTFPARMVVRVTRKAGTGTITPDLLALYRLSLAFDAVNPESAGRAYSVATNTCWNDNGSFPCDPKLVKTTGPLRGPLFAPVNGPLPALQPGQSVQVPFWLTIVPYWIPGHQDLIKQAGGFVQYNDWQHLYYGATVTGSAAILCPSTTTLEPAPCAPPAKATLKIPGTTS